ncbi:MAG: tRNA dihydrouridine synthase DusB [bacterium]
MPQAMRLGGLAIPNNLWMSPLCGVTDIPFRTLVKEQGAGLVHTQMVSCAALARNGDSNQRSQEIMALAPGEGPVGIQLFGCDLEEMALGARMVEEKGADLVSINFGCPVPKVVKHNGGSALLKEPTTVEAVTRAVVRATRLPVVPKIRLGWDEASVNAVEIAQRIEQAGAVALVVHGRTRSQGYGGRADWGVIAAVKRAVAIPVIGNGDLFTPADISLQLRESGVDGVMLGRGAMGNPWLFRRALEVLDGRPDPGTASAVERVAVLARHTALAHERRGRTALAEMRKHAMWYLKGLPEAAERRRELNATLDFGEIQAILESYRVWLLEHPEALAADREASFADSDGGSGLAEAV